MSKKLSFICKKKIMNKGQGRISSAKWAHTVYLKFIVIPFKKSEIRFVRANSSGLVDIEPQV